MNLIYEKHMFFICLSKHVFFMCSTIACVVSIIGNSNTTGLAEELNCRGVDSTGFVYRGTSSELLASRVKYTKNTANLTCVIVLSGQIDIREKKMPRKPYYLTIN